MSPNPTPGNSEKAAVAQNEKLTNAKQALKAKLMRAVMQQALQELGDSTVIADFAFNQIRSNTNLLDTATSSLKEKITKHILQESAVPFKDQGTTTDALFELIKKDTSVVAEATGALRNRIADYVKEFSISGMEDSSTYASQLFSTLEKDAIEISTAAQELSKLIDRYISNRVVDNFSDSEGKAKELAPAIAQSDNVTSVTTALSQILQAEIVARTTRSLDNANDVASSLQGTLSDSNVVNEAVASLRDKLMEDVRSKSLELIGRAEDAAIRARQAMGDDPEIVEKITAEVRANLVREIADRSIDTISDVSRSATEARQLVGDDHPAVGRIREAVKAQLLKNVMETALNELNSDLSSAATDIGGSIASFDTSVIDETPGDIPSIDLLDSAVELSDEADLEYDEVIEADFDATTSPFDDLPADDLQESATTEVPDFSSEPIYDETLSLDEIEIGESAKDLAATSEADPAPVESSFVVEDLEEDPFGDLDFDEIDAQDAIESETVVELEAGIVDEPNAVDELISDDYLDDNTDAVSDEVQLFQDELKEVQGNDPYAIDGDNSDEEVVQAADLVGEDDSEPEWQSIENYSHIEFGDVADNGTLADTEGNPEGEAEGTVVDLEAEIGDDWSLEEVSLDEGTVDQVEDIENASNEETTSVEESALPVATPIEDSIAYYAYGVVSDEDAQSDTSMIEGIDPDYRVQAVAHEDLRIFVSKVPTRVYGSSAVKEQMQDAHWLKDQVSGHAEIVETLKEGRTLIPMRFCTVYSSVDEITTMLAERYDHFSGLLNRVRGKQEWALKIYRDKSVLADRVLESEKKVEDSLGFISKGVVHFVKDEMNRLSSDSEKSVELMSEHCATRSHAALVERASEGVLKPAMNDENGDVILNAAYLIPIGEESGLKEELERLRSEYGGLGFEYELKGPWPPYHFVGHSGDTSSKVTTH